VTVDEFASKYPRLYHVSAAGSWPSIQRSGLLSVAALLDLFEYEPMLRDQVMSTRRTSPLVLEHPIHGRAVLRDQKVLSEAKLRACLTDMPVEEWLRLLNGKVFFWLSLSRTGRLRQAKEYRANDDTVLTVDTRSLLNAYCGSVELSPINSGATLHKAAARGSTTFRPFALYDILERRQPVEFAVSDRVDVQTHVITVDGA
jgi:hypothetical protein